jgi:hypothetical protein
MQPLEVLAQIESEFPLGLVEELIGPTGHRHGLKQKRLAADVREFIAVAADFSPDERLDCLILPDVGNGL